MALQMVVGFLFSEDFEYVALIRKETPSWQKGRLNGLGGKVERGEESLAAMRREFNEEGGVDVSDWKRYLTLTGPSKDFELHVFYATGPVHDVRTMEAEAVIVTKASAVLCGDLTTLGNIPWLVAMACAIGKGKESARLFHVQEMTYRGHESA